MTEDLAFKMGTAIVVGFTIMLIIDESFKILQQNATLDQTMLMTYATTDDERKNLLNDDDDDEQQKNLDAGSDEEIQKREQEVQLIESDKGSGKNNVFIKTIGLAIHSLADGAALGAGLYLESFGESNSGLGMIIFIAIMLHKAPASLGFGTYLQHQGCNAKEHLQHLFVSSHFHAKKSAKVVKFDSPTVFLI